MVDRRYSGRYTKDCVVLHLSPVWNHTPAARNCALAPRSLATSETSEMSRSGSIGLGEAVEMPSRNGVPACHRVFVTGFSSRTAVTSCKSWTGARIGPSCKRTIRTTTSRFFRNNRKSGSSPGSMRTFCICSPCKGANRLWKVTDPRSSVNQHSKRSCVPPRSQPTLQPAQTLTVYAGPKPKRRNLATTEAWLECERPRSAAPRQLPAEE
jgi:hypothetical protein